MSWQWYVLRNGVPHGPHTSAELARFAELHKLSRTDLIWKEGMDTWMVAGELRTLFPVEVLPTPSTPVGVSASPQPSTAKSSEPTEDAKSAKIFDRLKKADQVVSKPANVLGLRDIPLPTGVDASQPIPTPQVEATSTTAKAAVAPSHGKLIICYVCKKPVADNAPNCPHCGAVQTPEGRSEGYELQANKEFATLVLVGILCLVSRTK